MADTRMGHRAVEGGDVRPPATPPRADVAAVHKVDAPSPCGVEDAPLSGHVEDEAKKEHLRRRKRTDMARYRMEQRERLDAMRRQEEGLQRILQCALGHKKPVAGEARSVLQQYQARFTELVRMREQLLLEKRDLSSQLIFHEQRARAFESILEQMASKMTLNRGDESTIEGEEASCDAERKGMSDGQYTYDADVLLHEIELLEELEQVFKDDGAAKETTSSQQHGASEWFRRQRLLRMERRTTVHAAGQDRAGYWFQFRENEPDFYYEYESSEACATTIQQGLRSIQQIRQALLNCPSNALSGTFLGWTVERYVDKQRSEGPIKLFMRCSRFISRHRAGVDELQEKTWQFLNSPDQISKVNHSSVTASIMQRLNNDAIVLFRNSPTQDDSKLIRYFSLNTRLRAPTDHSATILMVILDKQARQRPHFPADAPTPVTWIRQGCSGFRFSLASRESVEIEYSGCIEVLSDAHATHLMLENFSALLRWEHLMVPPRLLL